MRLVADKWQNLLSVSKVYIYYSEPQTLFSSKISKKNSAWFEIIIVILKEIRKVGQSERD